MSEWLIEWVNDLLNAWMTDWMSERGRDWATELMTDWMSEWLIEWVNDRLNEWMTDLMSERGTKWLSEWLIEIVNDWLNELMTDWMSKRGTERLSDWVTEWQWMSERGTERLIDWVTGWMSDELTEPQILLWERTVRCFAIKVTKKSQNQNCQESKSVKNDQKYKQKVPKVDFLKRYQNKLFFVKRSNTRILLENLRQKAFTSNTTKDTTTTLVYCLQVSDLQTSLEAFRQCTIAIGVHPP